MSNQCAFEPDSVEITCFECDKPIVGTSGTCTDKGLCPACRTAYLDAGLSEQDVSAMLISVIEGEPFNAKYIRHRVLHFNDGTGVACHASGGPHPVTDDRNATNCKRCLRAITRKA